MRPGPRCALCFLILLSCWPPLHMLWSSQGLFSSWRLGGWGMYATPHPDVHDRIHIVPHSEPSPEALGRVVGLSVGRSNAPFEALDSPNLPPARGVAEACRALSQFGQPNAATFLLKRGQKRGAEGDVHVLRPRVDLLSLRVGFEDTRYRVHNGTIEVHHANAPRMAIAARRGTHLNSR